MINKSQFQKFFEGLSDKEVDRRWKIYEWEEEQMMRMMYEQAKAQQATVTAIPSGAGGSGQTTYNFNKFIAAFGSDLISGGGVRLTYIDIDTSGNICVGGNLYNSSGTVLRSFSEEGDVTLVKAETITNGYGGDIDFSQAKFGPDGSIYEALVNGIRKLDSNGNEIWKNTWGNSGFYNYGGITFGLNGEIYLLGQSSLPNFGYIMQVDPITGVITKSKKINFTFAQNVYTYSQPFIDQQGNVYAAFPTYNLSNEYLTPMFKFSPDLETVIWTKNINELDFSGEDCDMSGFAMDRNQNIYGCLYGHSIFKMDPTGNVLWCKQLNPVEYLYNLAVTPAGEVYWIGYDNFGIYPDDRIIIVKFSTDGVYEWATSVYRSGFNLQVPWDTSCNGASIKYDTLLISVSANYDESYVMKLPLTQLVGQYGDLTFEDSTNDIAFNDISTSSLNTPYIITDEDPTVSQTAVFGNVSISQTLQVTEI